MLTVMILYLAIPSDFPPSLPSPKHLVLMLQPQLLVEPLASTGELSQPPLLDLVQVRSGYVLNASLKEAAAAAVSSGFYKQVPFVIASVL